MIAPRRFQVQRLGRVVHALEREVRRLGGDPCDLKNEVLVTHYALEAIEKGVSTAPLSTTPTPPDSHRPSPSRVAERASRASPLPHRSDPHRRSEASVANTPFPEARKSRGPAFDVDKNRDTRRLPRTSSSDAPRSCSRALTGPHKAASHRFRAMSGGGYSSGGFTSGVSWSGGGRKRGGERERTPRANSLLSFRFIGILVG